jgi:hypothetical protein
MPCIEPKSLRKQPRVQGTFLMTRHISDDTKCPIHPNASHTWGECYANAANKKAHKTNGDKDKKRPGQLKKNEVDRNAMHIGNDNVSIASSVTSLGATDSISTALAPCC